MSDNEHKSEEDAKLFVGGLAWATTGDSLKDAFSKYGEVTEARVVTEKATGKSRGFGFVSFSSKNQATEAKEGLDNTELDGRTIRVDFASPKDGT